MRGSLEVRKIARIGDTKAGQEEKWQREEWQAKSGAEDYLE